MKIVSCANTLLLDSQKLFFLLMFQEHCWRSFAKAVQHDVERKRWKKVMLLFWTIITGWTQSNSDFKIIWPRMPLHHAFIFTRYCNESYKRLIRPTKNMAYLLKLTVFLMNITWTVTFLNTIIYCRVRIFTYRRYAHRVTLYKKNALLLELAWPNKCLTYFYLLFLHYSFFRLSPRVRGHLN